MEKSLAQSTPYPCFHKRDLDRDGFVVIREFMPAGELRELQEQLDRYIRDVVPKLPDGDAFFEDRKRPETLKQMQRSP